MRIVDASTLTENEFDSVLALRQTLDVHKDPDLPPTTADELRLRLTVDDTEAADHERVAAFFDERAIAIGHLERPRDPANPTLACIQLDAREADLATARPTVGHLLDLAEADGRGSILAWGDLSDATDAFWTGFGATQRSVDRDSDLHLADVDPALMQKWIDAHHERASTVRLVSWVGVPPAEHMAAFVETRNAMNDAPRDDLEVNDYFETAVETTRDARAWSALGLEMHVILAIEADGSAVGNTTVLVNTHRPEASLQWDTVVLDRHRRRGVGRWLKAAMYQYLVEDLPQVTRLRTSNAESNDSMLAINVEMGFQPAHASAGWQTDMATFRAGLAA